MKCYLCKKEVTTATRKYMDARNGREKAQYRDLCETCYPAQMEAEGYVLLENHAVPMWAKANSAVVTKTAIRVGDKLKRNDEIWKVISTLPGGMIGLYCKEKSRFMDRYHRELKTWERVEA